MLKNENIVRYTAEELRQKREREGTLTDWERVRALTYEEIEAAIASDPDEAGWVYDWDNVIIGFPGPKRQLTVRLDGDIIDWFKATGKGYQTRMNAVLRSYVEVEKRQDLERQKAARAGEPLTGE